MKSRFKRISWLAWTAAALVVLLWGLLVPAGVASPADAGGDPQWPSHGIELRLAVQLPGDLSAAEHAEALTNIYAILRDRLEERKVAFTMEPAPEDRLVVRLPKSLELKAAEIGKALTQTGYIEFRLVFPESETIDGTISGDSPPGYERLTLTINDQGRESEQVLWVKRVPELTGDMIERASVMKNPYGSYTISLLFDANGRTRFATVTRKLADAQAATGEPRRLAIVVDGAMIAAPVVRDEISGGEAQIAGSFSWREAMELANLLNNPVEARIRIEGQRHFGPE